MNRKNIPAEQLISIILLSLFLFSFLLFTSTSIFAEEMPTPGLGAPTFETIDFDYQKGIGELVKYIIIWAFRLAGIFAFIMISFAGFQYLTAGGNTNQQKEAQERIFNAIIGIILLFSFWLILNTINPDILGEKEIYVPSIQEEKEDIRKLQKIPKNFVEIGSKESGKYAQIPLSNELSSYPYGVYIGRETADKLLVLANNPNTPKGWKVSEACIGFSSSGQCLTTYTSHKSKCHSLGTCVDVGFGSNPGYNTRAEFIYAANQAGFDVIDEYSSAGSNLGSGFHLEINMSTCNPTPPYYCI